MTEAVASPLKDLRRTLRLMHGQQARLDHLQSHGMAHTMRRRLICTLIASLCNDDALARIWTAAMAAAILVTPCGESLLQTQ